MSAEGISTHIRKRGILLTLDAALIDTIDSLRGDTPRTVWITRAIETKMSEVAAPLAGTEMAGSEPGRIHRAVGSRTGSNPRLDSGSPAIAAMPIWTDDKVMVGKLLPYGIAERSVLSQDCHTTQHFRAKARHGRCQDCGQKP